MAGLEGATHAAPQAQAQADEHSAVAQVLAVGLTFSKTSETKSPDAKQD
jgi:hypothetical protein